MLRKLMKYEFKATGRIMLPLYAVLLCLAIINKLFIGVNFIETNIEGYAGIPFVLSMMAYVATVVGVSIGTLFIIVQRFYKNIYGDEGYLMNTIPVSRVQNIVSKLLVSMIWVMASFIVSVISVLIMAYIPNMFKDVISEFKILFSYEDINILLIIQFIVLALVALAHEIMSFYASISLGQLFSAKKLLGAFLAFMIIRFTEQAILGIGGVAVFSSIDIYNMHPQIIMLIGTIIVAIFFTILFYTTHYILKNKLNLE
ncbi:MAG: ABC transporter permease [Clostridium sp.]|nr:ABC transporter permease [Clostridium sp.]